MKIKATVSFAGLTSMRVGEERDVEETDTIKDLIASGHVVVLKENKSKAKPEEDFREGLEGDSRKGEKGEETPGGEDEGQPADK